MSARAASRAAAACAALAALAGCAELGLVPAGVKPPPDPKPVLREPRHPSSTFGASLIARRRVDGLKLEVYNAGLGQVRGHMLSELKSPEARLKPPVLVGAVRHPKAGVILFGGGLPEDLGGLGAARVKGSALSPFTIPPGKDLLSQLAIRRVAPEDVSWVILPDIAPEWTGRAGAFPKATVAVSKDAWDAPRKRAAQGDLPDPKAFVPEERLKLLDMKKAPPFGPFEHGLDLLEDGTLIVVDLEGGAAGGLGLWVNLDSGPALLTGPAAFVYDNVFDAALPDRNFVVDLSSFAWNVRAMRIARDSVPRLLVIPAHDASSMKLAPRPDAELVP